MSTTHRADVAVVGAGLAGLAAARRLDARGIDVRVLEARDRVGGRTLSREVDDEVVDLGAQWIGPSQDAVHDLVDEFDVETFPQYADGDAQFGRAGEVGRSGSAVGALPTSAQVNLQFAVRRIETHREKLPSGAPQEAPTAATWDATTVATWRDRVLRTAAARDAFDAIVRAVFTSEPAELSMLYLLAYVDAAGGFGPLTAVEGGAQQTRLVGGTQQLAEGLAATLDGTVHLGAPVREIAHDGDGVTIGAEDVAVEAAYAVVAVPPTLAGRIRYDPALPAARDGLTQRSPMGSVVKCVATYDEPFWRADGLSGEALDADGPIGLLFDDSPADGSTGALVGFFLADDAREWADASEAERREAFCEWATDYVGPEATEPTAYVDQAWPNERYSAGCYAGVAGPGTLTRYGEALREPVGRIHWAGTETATEWTGYMDGAIRSGRRAADEVLDRLA